MRQHATHVIRTRHQRAAPRPACSPRSILCGLTERVCFQRNKGQCPVSSHFQLTGPILKEKRGAANKQLLFLRKQDGVCCYSAGCDVIVMDQPLRDLCAYDAPTSSSGAAHQLQD
ncbi:Hypothetical predicted protein [Xyrichtys novacula]|uniref:Uncharacterized protein n=1 Tax=Xyrichtys novacula TaxID=13765 RepID=A0AAV1G2J5_XYRNO|nr:Hypothetical predicted protein [Xyrichtys novacula]